jgi:hypothetical protein
MKHVRNLIQDLIDRRLWPVALLLAVALAAVPMVLGRSGDAATDTAALPATPATDSGTQKAAVTLDTSVPAEIDRRGARRNPFKAPASAKPKSDTQVATPSSSATSASTATAPASADQTVTSGGSSAAPSTSDATDSTDSTSSGTTTAKPKTTTTSKTTTAPKADDATDTYHVSLRIGLVKADGTADLKTVRDVARLSALPSVTDPFFVYLGVLETATTHEKRAVFLVSSDATPNGEGSCHPTKDDCESVELAVGQTAFFDYTAPSGAVTQYQLQLAGIHKTEVSTEAKASAAFARHSAAGAELLSDAAKRNVRAAAGARAYRYIPATGLLQRAKRKHVTARAAAAGTMIPGLALVSRKHQPGIPVWHSPKG